MQFIKSIKLKDAACLFFSHQTLWTLLTCINWTDNIFCKHQQIQWQVQWARWGMMPLSSCGTVSSKIPDNLCSGTCLAFFLTQVTSASPPSSISFSWTAPCSQHVTWLAHTSPLDPSAHIISLTRPCLALIHYFSCPEHTWFLAFPPQLLGCLLCVSVVLRIDPGVSSMLGKHSSADQPSTVSFIHPKP